MADTEGNVTIIKRIKKGGEGHHGGAWKVAYADFVTAMMAFFLLLWLLNSVTEEQLQGISNYFAPVTVSQSPSGAGGMLGGRVIGEGASQSQSAQPIPSINLPPSTIGQGGDDFTDPAEGQVEMDRPTPADPAAQRRQEEIEREQEQFEQAAADLQEALRALPELEALRESLLVEHTPEGLRIQIVDQDGMPMFPAGSSAMYEHTRTMLELVGRVVRRLPQKIAIEGHTDARSFVDPDGYSNWELSADRALASRRVLLGAGVQDHRVARVSGVADSDPLLPDDPESFRNRRISITLIREAGMEPSGSGPQPLPAGRMPSILGR